MRAAPNLAIVCRMRNARLKSIAVVSAILLLTGCGSTAPTDDGGAGSSVPEKAPKRSAGGAAG